MITRPAEAEEMSQHLARFCRLVGLDEPRKLRVTDATAGCGGNALSLLRHVGHVTAVERDPLHFACLRNNLELYGHVEEKGGQGAATVKLINADYTQIFSVLQQDVVLLDCPWSDTIWYSRKRDLQLYLSDIPLYALVQEVFARDAARVVAIKAPLNFGLSLFMRKLPGNHVLKICRVYTFYLILVARDD